MIQKCAKGQGEYTNWTMMALMDSRRYDLWPGAYLDSGESAANRLQYLLSIKEDGPPLE